MGASQLMIYKDGAWVPWDGVMTVATSGAQSKDEKQKPQQATIARPKRRRKS